MLKYTLGASVWAAVGAIVGIVSTLFSRWLIFPGPKQLRSSNSVAKRALFKKIETDFFCSSNARHISYLVRRDQLCFLDSPQIPDDPESLGYFEVKPLKLVPFEMQDETEEISAETMEAYLLGPLEAVGYLFKHNLFDLENVDNHFGKDIIETFENKEIQRYIHWLRQNAVSTHMYGDLEYLYKALIKYRSKKVSR